MSMHRIDLMGLDYVLMLGVWWGAAVLLTILYLAAKWTIVNRRQRLADFRDARAAIIRHIDA